MSGDSRQLGEEQPRDGSPAHRRMTRPPYQYAGCLVLAVVLSPCAGRAQEPAERAKSNVTITDVGGYIEFEARQRSQEQDSKVGAGRTTSDETLLQESIRLDFEGYVYHPNFLEFALGGLFGLVQRDFEDEFGRRRRTSRDDGPVYEFDFEGRFFRKKNYPGSVYARRRVATEPRPFQTSLEVTSTNIGLNWQYIHPKYATSVQFSYTDIELDPNSDFEDVSEQESTLFRLETGYAFTEQSALSFIYTHESSEEQPFDLQFDKDELTLKHRWTIGDEHQHRLESELNYFNQRGTFEIERFRWRETLRLWHDETLRSWYQFELIDRVQGNLAGVEPIDERTYTLRGTLEHTLYESLVTTVGVYGQDQEFGSGLNIQRFGGDISFDYRKTNRLGVLRSGYRFRARREEVSGGEQIGEVLDEAHTFRDPDPVVLSNTRVDRSSIFITAEDRTTIYRLGSDYTVRTVGDRVEIERRPTGRILDGQTVLIDYLFRIGGDFDLDTVEHFFTFQQNFDFGLSPYYRFHKKDQSVSDKGFSGIIPEDITAHIVGVEFEQGPFDLSAEYEDYDSSISPFTAVRLGIGVRHRFRTGATGTLKARWIRMERTERISRNTRFFTIEGRYRHPVTQHLTFEGTVLYRNENDTISGHNEGVDLDLTLEWRIRETDLRVTYEFGQYDDDFAENEYSTLYVLWRRRF